MDSLDSCRISVPGSTQEHGGRQSVFAYGAITLFGRLSHTIPLTNRFVTPIYQTLQPRPCKHRRFRLFPVRSPLLRESQLISFPKGTEMFHFPSFASYDYVFIIRYLPYDRWVSPFRNLRITGYLPPPRSLSQAITSFIASDCQGIHHMHLIT